MHFFYLHGFASSPSSGKARFFADHLAARGLSLECLDLNLPDFETLTITRMLDQLDALIDSRPPGPIALIGSSLGGLTALHAASRRNAIARQPRPVSHLVLLAPALGFARDLELDPELDEWRRAGKREVFHYGEGRPRVIGFQLYEDARRYDSSRVQLDLPVLIFQGRRDEVVAPATVIEFARSRPNVTLRLLDDDHRLQEHLPQIWRETAAFLAIEEGGRPAS